MYDPDKQTVNWQDLGPDTILLSRTLEHLSLEPGKPRFTLMHECAHHLLHKRYFQRKAASGSGKAIAHSIQRDQIIVPTQEKRAWTDEDRIEWQANYLASALLMPESRVNRVLIEKGYQEDYFQHVLAGSSEATVYQQLITRLASIFRVSMTTAKIRLEAVGFERLPDLQVRRPNPWNQYWPDQPKIRMTKEERREEKVELGWEKKIARERRR